MESADGFRIVRARAADRDRVERLAGVAFYPDEPLNAAAGNTAPPPAHEMLFLAALDEGHSLIAEDAATGEAVGMSINSVVTPESYEKKKQQQDEQETIGPVRRVLRAAWAEADVWSQTSARSALEVRILAVAGSARGRGLAGRLLAESLRLARQELRQPLALITCTSAFTAALARRVGMRLVYELPYSRAGLPKLPPQPHESLTIYMMELQD